MAITTLITAGLLAAGAVAGGGASVPAGHPAPATGAPVAQVRDGNCSSNWTHGIASVDMVITNNTSFPLTYDPSLSRPSSGHWNERPATTLLPGQCEVVNAYTDSNIFDNFTLNVVYLTSWGDTIPFEGIAAGTSTYYNPNVFIGTPTYSSSSLVWTGAIDSRYSIGNTRADGWMHVHYTQALS